MTGFIRFKINEKREEENFDRFVRKVSKQAERLQTELEIQSTAHSDKDAAVSLKREPKRFLRSRIRHGDPRLKAAVNESQRKL